MNILVINCGSSSLKYQLIDMKEEKVLAKGLSERIGIEGSRIKHKTTGKEEVVIEKPMENHKIVLELVLKTLVDPVHGAIKSMDEISAVGHRVVHGGEKFATSVKIDDEVMKALNDCVDLAPLHNPPNIMGIEACKELMPNTPMVGVFDTAFHQTMPKSNYIYPLPYELYEKYGVRKYGFHGTSHKYVSLKTAEILGKDIKDLKIITCHLGNGASVCAVENGKSIDTSMGFTPLEGLAMGTRTGDLDPAIIPFLMDKENLTIEDVRDLEEAAEKGNDRAELALKIFVNRVKKYIGAYIVLMGGVDAIVFTAGIGENSVEIREMICKGLDKIDIELDVEKNNVRGKEAIISKDDSKVKILVVPTNEELMIARDTKELA